MARIVPRVRPPGGQGPRACPSGAPPRPTVVVSTTPATPSTAPVRERDPETFDEVTPDGPWDVIVWDDPVNLMSYVVYVFRKIFGFPDAVAHKLMLEVHNNGKALVATEPREMAEMHVHQLHAHGLQATMQRSR